MTESLCRTCAHPRVYQAVRSQYLSYIPITGYRQWLLCRRFAEGPGEGTGTLVKADVVSGQVCGEGWGVRGAAERTRNVWNGSEV